MATRKNGEETVSMIDTFKEFKDTKNIDRTTLMSVVRSMFFVSLNSLKVSIMLTVSSPFFLVAISVYCCFLWVYRESRENWEGWE